MSMVERVDYEDVEHTLCVPGGHFQRNRSGAPIHIIRPHLTPLAKYWMAFSHANIQPCSHSCASGVTSKAPLGHPYLITHLCEAADIDVSRPPLERPRKELDAAYFTHYCAVDEPGHPAPPPQQPKVHNRAPPLAQEPVHDAVPFQMRNMYYSLLDFRLAALYRGE
ncbi:hypothetical protein LR48_Vigan264s000700 [Vigna angularis]|uniref:Putative plant transposon protein domain-containing protein n=1 Tax=Phaseolus angularis TaxID=3914 RepID=A0A0L9T737_PHAAN|nr:hypothetical protein LR48_Vigan264s000700 [Vigna angularis]